MKSTSIPCTESGCDYVAEHKKEVVAKRMLGMHRRSAHGIVGLHAQRNGTAPHKHAHKNGRAHKSLLVPALRVVDPQLKSPEEVIRKVVDELAFCPKCGKDLQRFVLATIALAKHE